MPRTIGDCIRDARELLQDTVEPYRYSEADLYALFSTAIADARRLRPDLFIGRLRAAVPVYSVGNAQTAFPVDEQFFGAFVYYVVGRAELRNDQYSADNRANALITSFGVQLQGRGA